MTSKEFQSYREKLGLTQTDLAKQLHVKYWTLVKWESGGTIPDCVQYLFSILHKVPYVERLDTQEDDSTLDLPF